MDDIRESILEKNGEKKLNILKGFKETEDFFEKAKSGTYADTPENRKLNRVGQNYGSKKSDESKTENKTTEKETSKKEEKKRPPEENSGEDKEYLQNLFDHAINTKTEDLKKFIKDNENNGKKMNEVEIAKNVLKIREED